MTRCPGDEQLSGFAMGTLPPAEIELLTAHLEQCPACEARAGQLDDLSDPLINGLRARAGLSRPDAATTFDAAPAALDLCPGQVLGDYVLGEQLGAGGMGNVFRATHARMRRDVALKVVSRRAMRAPDAARRFAREVEAAARLIHPNIAIAHDARDHDGVVFLIMEYVAGTDLARLVKQRGPLPPAAAVDYVAQAARGLAYAHERGIVHRDVKPANLMLDDHGVVKVLDMGLSRFRERADLPSSATPESPGAAAAADFTQAGDVLGTVGFVAPEQVQNPRDADHRADVYGLGCSLYYLLTGRNAFARASAAATLAAHRDESPPSLRRDRPGVSARLDAAFARMVAKRPADRFASMADVIAALQSCPESAAPSARRPRAAAALAACLALILAVAAVWRWQPARVPGNAVAPASTATSRLQGARPAVPAVPFSPEQAVRHRDAWRAYANAPPTTRNSVGMTFAFIPPGEYQNLSGNTVRITRPFYMGTHEITIAQFRQFARAAKYRTTAERLGGVSDGPKGFEHRMDLNWQSSPNALSDDHPALQLSYADVAAMARWLSQQEGKAYRLPTMARWIWAYQAGTPAPALWDAGEPADAYGWNRLNSDHHAHAVGLLKPNPWGLYDVRGNAAEWCEDWQFSSPAPPQAGLLEDPSGPATGTLKLLLGSTYGNDDPDTYPGNAGQENMYPTWGGRLTCEIDGAPSIAAPPTTAKARADVGGRTESPP